MEQGDYKTAHEMFKKAERRLNEIEIMDSNQRAAGTTGYQAQASSATRYQCPSCGKPFQVTPPSYRPFDVACPWCRTTVRITR